MNTGTIIKDLRTKKGMTQEELAKKCNLSKNAIWNYENNKRTPNIPTLGKISKILGVSIFTFLNTEHSFSMELILAVERAWINKNDGYVIKDIIQCIADDLNLDYEIFNCFKEKKIIMEVKSDGTHDFQEAINEDFDPSKELPTEIQIKLLNYLYSIDSDTFLNFKETYNAFDVDKNVRTRMAELSLSDFMYKSGTSIKPIKPIKEFYKNIDDILEKYIKFIASINDIEINKTQAQRIISKVTDLIDDEIFKEGE